MLDITKRLHEAATKRAQKYVHELGNYDGTMIGILTVLASSAPAEFKIQMIAEHVERARDDHPDATWVKDPAKWTFPK